MIRGVRIESSHCIINIWTFCLPDDEFVHTVSTSQSSHLPHLIDSRVDRRRRIQEWPSRESAEARRLPTLRQWFSGVDQDLRHRCASDNPPARDLAGCAVPDAQL